MIKGSRRNKPKQQPAADRKQTKYTKAERRERFAHCFGASRPGASPRSQQNELSEPVVGEKGLEEREASLKHEVFLGRKREARSEINRVLEDLMTDLSEPPSRSDVSEYKKFIVRLDSFFKEFFPGNREVKRFGHIVAKLALRFMKNHQEEGWQEVLTGFEKLMASRNISLNDEHLDEVSQNFASVFEAALEEGVLSTRNHAALEQVLSSVKRDAALSSQERANNYEAREMLENAVQKFGEILVKDRGFFSQQTSKRGLLGETKEALFKQIAELLQKPNKRLHGELLAKMTPEAQRLFRALTKKDVLQRIARVVKESYNYVAERFGLGFAAVFTTFLVVAVVIKMSQIGFDPKLAIWACWIFAIILWTYFVNHGNPLPVVRHMLTGRRA